MKKSQLKSGMYLEFKDDKMCIVLLNTEKGDIIVNNNITECNGFNRLYNTWGLDNFSDDLRDISQHNVTGDIIKVYGLYGNLIWERPNMPELTMKQVIDKLGFKFKLIK